MPLTKFLKLHETMSLPTGSLAWRALGLCFVLALLPAAKVMAQTNERLYENLDFRFETPGARPLGMGRAFVGLAEDATAALSNPAGLSNLLEQEFSLEFRGANLKRRPTASFGSGDSDAFGQFVFTPSFMSYALPFERATLLLFRNSLQDFKESFEFGPRTVPRREAPEDGAFGSIAVSAENFGVGGAYVVNRALSLGGSIDLVSLDLASEARSGTRLNPRNGTNTIASGYRWSGSAGVLFKPRHGVAIGGTYQLRSTFPMQTRLFGRFLWTQFDPDGTVILTGEARKFDYVIPARYAVGSSWRVRNNVTLAADISRVLYSQRITNNFLVVDFIDPGAGLTPTNFYVKDVAEVHAGAEYRFYGPRSTMAVRGGIFTDSNHPLRFRSGGNNLAHPANTLLDFRFNTVPDRTDVGATAGVGVGLANRIQVDAAGSFVRNQIEFVASLVYRLK
jgi:hypothetical protein